MIIRRYATYQVAGVSRQDPVVILIYCVRYVVEITRVSMG